MIISLFTRSRFYPLSVRAFKVKFKCTDVKKEKIELKIVSHLGFMGKNIV